MFYWHKGYEMETLETDQRIYKELISDKVIPEELWEKGKRCLFSTRS